MTSHNCNHDKVSLVSVETQPEGMLAGKFLICVNGSLILMNQSVQYRSKLGMLEMIRKGNR